jgi:hypothetical protein
MPNVVEKRRPRAGGHRGFGEAANALTHPRQTGCNSSALQLKVDEGVKKGHIFYDRAARGRA